MMKLTKTTIAIQSQQRIVVRPLRESILAWCRQCRAEVLAITPECLIGVLRVAPRDLYAMLESGELHALEAAPGSILICCDRLPAVSTTNKIQIEGERQ